VAALTTIGSRPASRGPAHPVRSRSAASALFLLWFAMGPLKGRLGVGWGSPRHRTGHTP